MDIADENGPDDGASLVVDERETGTLIVGDETAVARFVAEWGVERGVEPSAVELSGRDLRVALSAAADVGAVAATAAQYLRVTSSVPAGGTATLRLWITDRSGQIISNKAVSPASVYGPSALGMVALRVAIEETTSRIVEAVERVEGKTDELLRLVGAERTGDVLGHHRLLRRRVERLDDGVRPGETDWSTVASLGPELEVGVERLREHALRMVRELPPRMNASERAERLVRVVREGRLGEVMRLLVVAEQSLYLWQRLRIARIEDAEPGGLEAAVADSHGVLAEHLEADTALVIQLRDALDAYGALKLSEIHRTFSGRKLRASVEALHHDLDYFVDARRVQVEGWAPLVAPTVRDALRAARSAAIESGRSVRAFGGKVLDNGLAGVSRAGGAVQSTADKWRGAPQEPADEPENRS